MVRVQEQGQESAAKRGFIISYNSENGYGFVRGEDVQDFYFNIRAFKENTLPQVGQKVVFELSNKPAKEGKNPPISWLKYDESGANEVEQGSGAATKLQSNDSRIVCPHCGAKVMPRVVIVNNAPYASHCPICGGKIKQFQKVFRYIVMLATPIILLILAVFFLPPVMWFFRWLLDILGIKI